MANKELQSRIIHKHDIAENWAKATNFIPKQGELIVYDIDDEFTYERFKIGDGKTTVANLPFMPGPADTELVVTATLVTEEIASTDYTSQQILGHVNNGGTSILVLDDLTLPLVMVEPENVEVGYGVTMVTDDGAEVTTMMVELNGNTATIRRAHYDPALAGFLTNADIYDKATIDEKVVELTEAIENAKGEKFVWLGQCNTDSGTAAKVVTTDSQDFELKDGSVVFVKFNTSNTTTITTLNVDGTGDKPAYAASSQKMFSYIVANTIGYNEIVPFVYNGLYYIRVNGNLASTNYYGITLLEDSISSTSTNKAATPNAVKQAYDLASTANTTASNASDIANEVKTASAQTKVDLDEHKTNTSNPHAVTASQVGADPAGTAANVVAAHANNTENPHGVTKEQLGISTVTNNADGLMSSTDKAKLDEMHTKLDSIEEGANNFTHPSYTAKQSGLYKITVDNTGHVSSTSGVQKSDITTLGIPAQDTTYSVVSASNDGLMSSTDKTKLDGLVVDVASLQEEVEDLEEYVHDAKNVWYGTSTNSNGADKIVTTTTGDFTLNTGNVLYVKFGINHTGSSMTLCVDGLDAMPVYSSGRINIASGLIASEETVCFVYTGEYFKILGKVIADTSRYGVVKLSNATNSTSKTLAATPYAVKQAYDLATEANTLASEAKTAAAEAELAASEVVGSVNIHNTTTDAHNDIRVLINGLSERINAIANSSDTDLDTLAEIVAYIKSNKTLLDEVTVNKVDVSDIVDNLTTNVSNQPLSAAQGVALDSAKAPKPLIVSSSYDENSKLVSNYSSNEILTHLAQGGDTMYNDIDLGRFAYLWAYVGKVYYGGTVIWGDTLALIVYEISGNNITNKFVSYNNFVSSEDVYTKDEIDDALAFIPATYETQGGANAKLAEAKGYTDDLGEAFGQVLIAMYGDDVPEDDSIPSIREIAHDEVNKMIGAILNGAS